MIISLKRTAAYFCPYCSGLSTASLSVFRFSGSNEIKLSCTSAGCRKNSIRIAAGQGKYRITAECPLCEDSHTFTVSQKAFWNRPFIKLDCPNTKIGIFFVGSAARVNKAVAQHAHDVAEFEEAQDDLEDMLPGDDMQLIYGIADVMNRLLTEGRVSCKCRCRDIEAGFSEDSLVLTCTRCRERTELEISYDLLHRLSSMEQIILGKNI